MNIKTLKTSWWVPTSYVIINSSRVQCLKKNEQNITTRKRIHTCLKRLTLQYPRYKLQAQQTSSYSNRAQFPTRSIYRKH